MKIVTVPKARLKEIVIEVEYDRHVRFGHQNMARLRARSKRHNTSKHYDRRSGKAVVA